MFSISCTLIILIKRKKEKKLCGVRDTIFSSDTKYVELVVNASHFQAPIVSNEFFNLLMYAPRLILRFENQYFLLLFVFELLILFEAGLSCSQINKDRLMQDVLFAKETKYCLKMLLMRGSQIVYLRKQDLLNNNNNKNDDDDD
ncbi:hypothetical protein BpHYR1_018364 [Brachionus plicatilis]|uniref:Uncharacterized protein n=1 Tax=Brachionus plicatilis TaxID=10195 RepID=A0A3M7PBA4_BRAPC|nr:hypothetical protein BpHYR1_018364 [Brachionus plicatilis]